MIDVAIVGSGMAGLSAACLLAKEGLSVQVLEQNWLAGGCTTSYPRKKFVFESGATTLVGLDEHMPVRYLCEQLNINLNARRLKLPMQVWLPDGQLLNRYEPLEQWIAEAEQKFGQPQRKFWEFAFAVSRFVWETSLRQRYFPPSNLADVLKTIGNVTPKQLRYGPLAFVTTKQLLKRYGLWENELFQAFVDQQLLITAQNSAEEVNALFGCAALCYTNYGNYYTDGGMSGLVSPFVQWLENKGHPVLLRHEVQSVSRSSKGYKLQVKHKTEQRQFEAKKVVFAIPLNNVLELADASLQPRFSDKVMESEQLNSAFQMGLAFTPERNYNSLHHQIHTPEGLPFTGSKSFFLEPEP